MGEVSLREEQPVGVARPERAPLDRESLTKPGAFVPGVAAERAPSAAGRHDAERPQMNELADRTANGGQRLSFWARRRAWFERWPWLPFVLPLAVFMLLTALEPTPEQSGGKMLGLAIPYAWYPGLYALKLVLTAAAVGFVLPGYGQFPLRLTHFGLAPLAAGIVGAALWVGLVEWRAPGAWIDPWLGRLGLDWIVATGRRSAFNPFEQLAGPPVWAWAFLVVRFAGLVVLVPVIEEFFLRAFAMRFAMQSDWWNVPFGKIDALAAVVGTVIPMLMHPGELLAAAAWFSWITLLMVYTRNIWDCIAAHAVTNLAMGIYAVGLERWYLL